jgi:hypothetical protein
MMLFSNRVTKCYCRNLRKKKRLFFPNRAIEVSYHYYAQSVCNWLLAGRLDDRGSIPGKGGRDWELFCSTPCPDRLWGPPSLLSNEYQEVFPWG